MVVEQRVFGLAGVAEAAGSVDDAGERWRRNARSANNKPAGTEDRIAVEDPYTGVGIGVERKIWRAARISNDKADAVLKWRTGFYLARSTARILPSVLEKKIAAIGIARNGRAAGRHHVRRGARVFDAWAVSRGGEEDDSRKDEGGVEVGFIRAFASAEAHGDFAPARFGHHAGAELSSAKEIEETVVGSLDEEYLGIGGHGMGPFNVQRLLDF